MNQVQYQQVSFKRSNINNTGIFPNTTKTDLFLLLLIKIPPLYKSSLDKKIYRIKNKINLPLTKPTVYIQIRIIVRGFCMLSQSSYDYLYIIIYIFETKNV